MAKKQNRQLSSRQKLYLKIKTEHPEYSNAKALRLAGYKETTIDSGGKNRFKEVKRKILIEYEKMGIDEKCLAKAMKEGLQAFKKTYFQHEGTVTDSKADIDFQTRKGYLELASKIRGDIIDRVEQANIYPEGIPLILSDDEKVRICREIGLLFPEELAKLKKKGI